jgi:Ca2+-binding EF-hand superfamily protein
MSSSSSLPARTTRAYTSAAAVVGAPASPKSTATTIPIVTATSSSSSQLQPPKKGRRPRNSGDAQRTKSAEDGQLSKPPPPSNSSDFFSGPEITGSGPESNDYSDQRALLAASGQLLAADSNGTNFGARTAKNLVEDDDQFMQYQMAAAAAAAAQVAQNPLMRLPPKLPSVDSHITREELKFENLTNELRKARNKFLKRPRKRQVSDDASTSLGSLGSDAGGFSIQEIRRVVNYIDDMNEDGTNDGHVDSNELTMAFRRARRARAGQKYEQLGRNVVYKLEHLMTLQNMTPAQWFEHMDGGANSKPGAKSDGRVTNLELRQGLAEMTSTKLFREYVFSEEELTNLLRYMDPNGDGDLDVQEVEDAIRRAHLDDAASAVEAEAGQIMQKLEDFMNEKQMRVIDLFMMLDEDGSGEITINELRKGLIKLAAPSAAERAAAKRKRLQEAAAAQESTLREQQERELAARMEMAKQTGAIKVRNREETFF